ncbi:hypothetical protein ERJ75_000839400 [Trypanosoma vivax]|uniref:Uncharacterized protein n=1 Tax=Trypanosoma vivax (strain Y486) TaxID=1055687 RepID=G0TSR5_TRYVY|nr:hypothetical protein ERJ75_001604700 [Trypanosoma vivax]KAH8612920.1 hypothetical protein ERJ75_000839400 [Trypanosoma vivax]CCC46993.1 conserved hypothetical protein [Trypanosoma vivax Y486]
MEGSSVMDPANPLSLIRVSNTATADSLMALSATLERLQEIVVAELNSLGVGGGQRGQRPSQLQLCSVLPPREGSFVERCAVETTEAHTGIGGSYCPFADSIDSYILTNRLKAANKEACDGSTVGVTQQDRRACVDALLRWADSLVPFEDMPSVGKSRDVLVSRLMCAAAVDDRRQCDMDQFREDLLFKPHWKHYASLMKLAHKSECAALEVVSATDIWKHLRSHEKCASLASELKLKFDSPPAPAVISLLEDSRRLMEAKDALANNQRTLMGLLSSVDDALSDYVEQCRMVNLQEEAFWRNFRVAEMECRVLKALSKRIMALC